MQFLTLTFVVFELALTARALTTLYPVVLPPMSRWDAAVLLVVSVGATAGLFAVLGGLARELGRRRSPRVELETEITVAGVAGTTLDITPSGLGAIVDAAPPIGAAAPFQLAIPVSGGAERRIEGTGTVRSATLHDSGSVRVGIEFDDMDITDRMAITEYCALGLSRTPSFGEATADHLVSDVSSAQLVVVRGLAVLSVLAAAGAVMLGPRAGVVAADSATPIPSVFTVTAGPDDEVVPPSDVALRLHTDGWSEPLAAGESGGFDRGAAPEVWDGSVHVEVVVGDDRHVEPVPTDGRIRLAVVDVDAGQVVAAAVVGTGGRWRTVVSGDPLVPGPYTVRWQVDDREPTTVTVRIDGGQVLQIGPGGVTVLSAAETEPSSDEVDDTRTTDSTTTTTDSSSTSDKKPGSKGRGRADETPAATRPPLRSSTTAPSTTTSPDGVEETESTGGADS